MAGRGPSPKAIAERRAAEVPPPVGDTGTPEPPDGLSDAGGELWEAIQGPWRLDEREAAVLLRACRLADVEQRLEDALATADVVVEGHAGQQRAHPLISELRQVNLAVCRLLSSLDLPGGDRPVSMTSKRAGNAAAARWREHNRVSAQRKALRG